MRPIRSRASAAPCVHLGRAKSLHSLRYDVGLWATYGEAGRCAVARRRFESAGPFARRQELGEIQASHCAIVWDGRAVPIIAASELRVCVSDQQRMAGISACQSRFAAAAEPCVQVSINNQRSGSAQKGTYLIERGPTVGS